MGNQHKNQSFNIQEASKNNLLGEKLAKARNAKSGKTARQSGADGAAVRD